MRSRTFSLLVALLLAAPAGAVSSTYYMQAGSQIRMTNQARGSVTTGIVPVTSVPSASADTSGAPADAVDFPDIQDTLWAPTATLTYRYDEHVKVIAGYRFEHYDQEDWQFDELGVTRGTSRVEGQPLLGTNNDVFLANGLEDYDANLFSLSVVYEF